MTLFLSKPVCCGAFVLPKLAVANSNPPSPFLPWTTSDVSEEVRGKPSFSSFSILCRHDERDYVNPLGVKIHNSSPQKDPKKSVYYIYSICSFLYTHTLTCIHMGIAAFTLYRYPSCRYNLRGSPVEFREDLSDGHQNVRTL